VELTVAAVEDPQAQKAAGGADVRQRVLVMAPNYLPAFQAGGPVRTLSAMVAAHGDRHHFSVLTSDRDHLEEQSLPVVTGRWTEVGKARVMYIRATPVEITWRLRSINKRLRPQVLYLNSLLNPRFSLLVLAMWQCGLLRTPKVVLAPRGELADGALALKHGKKALLLSGPAQVLTRGVVWHASSERERAEIIRYFPAARVVVRPNETLLPRRAQAPQLRKRSQRRLIFLGRISAIKGLHVLLDALARVKTPVELHVYGKADDAAYLSRCTRQAVVARAAGHRITFHGALPNEEVVLAFAMADYFVFPTANESFGHVVPESLSASCPVMMADVSPWTPILRLGGGTVVEQPDLTAWVRALEAVAMMDDEASLAARERAGWAYARWRSTEEPEASVFDLAEAMV
jgi:glycosyltransferase involved in cell wall biosynthesis